MVYSIAQLSDEVRTIYRKDNSPDGIDIYLEKRLKDLPVSEKLVIIQKISYEFALGEAQPQSASDNSEDQLLYFVSQLLGEPVETFPIDNNLLREKLQKSLETIFDALNELLQAINATISHDMALDETIRHVLKKQIDETKPEKPLGEYIGQIRKSFFTSYESFKKAHLHIMNKVLEELSPGKSLEECGGGLKFGALKKAEAFDNYTRFYESLLSWHKSGRGLEEYLRTFEKQCSNPTPNHEEINS